MNLFLICQPNGDFYILIFNNKGDSEKKERPVLLPRGTGRPFFECCSGLFIAIA